MKLWRYILIISTQSMLCFVLYVFLYIFSEGPECFIHHYIFQPSQETDDTNVIK